MYTCKALVNHGATLVVGASALGSVGGDSVARAFDTSSFAISPIPCALLTLHALANSFPHFGSREGASHVFQLQRRSVGDCQGLWHSFGALVRGSKVFASSRYDSSVSVSRPGSAPDGAEAARDSPVGDEKNLPKFDVSSNCVTPVFRVSPFIQKTSDLENTKVRVLFVSEGNVCRSVYAEAIFNSLIEEQGMQEFVECASKASRDYNVGESPDPRAVSVAEEFGLKLPAGATSCVFDCQADIVLFDLLVVMDKFNASDVLKEVTVYEAIDKGARYTQKVRRLAEFCRTKKMEDIDDPLYGNMGGPEELVLLRESYEDIRASCVGLMQTIMDIKGGLQDSETLKQGVARSLGAMESLDWLVPPMLQKADPMLFN
ncbi:uncharacterized protein [Physcomitrium patens]|uniref:Phosphotyrosine protein phosphatase I domain-containing protein n=1 Tax=Physcomitrium patens TaxID=3218 RepID=A0A2K1LA50_PHYPA|nr:uncharacterized protein LOC112279489 [Physcomitrium patens]PNR62903.1 hypothetical protein PHYPA_001328 [Physcomitrium patens]|eukprot:XP_024370148.1 uncharacterized protein LOC112279489 [Physcomitrella patens]